MITDIQTNLNAIEETRESLAEDEADEILDEQLDEAIFIAREGVNMEEAAAESAEAVPIFGPVATAGNDVAMEYGFSVFANAVNSMKKFVSPIMAMSKSMQSEIGQLTADANEVNSLKDNAVMLTSILSRMKMLSGQTASAIHAIYQRTEEQISHHELYCPTVRVYCASTVGNSQKLTKILSDIHHGIYDGENTVPARFRIDVTFPISLPHTGGTAGESNIFRMSYYTSSWASRSRPDTYRQLDANSLRHFLKMDKKAGYSFSESNLNANGVYTGTSWRHKVGDCSMPAKTRLVYATSILRPSDYVYHVMDLLKQRSDAFYVDEIRMDWTPQKEAKALIQLLISGVKPSWWSPKYSSLLLKGLLAPVELPGHTMPLGGYPLGNSNYNSVDAFSAGFTANMNQLISDVDAADVDDLTVVIDHEEEEGPHGPDPFMPPPGGFRIP
jgi:hypothetical protein